MRFCGRLIAGGLLLGLVIGGCGEEQQNAITPAVSSTATPVPPPTGPVVTFLGVTRADDTLVLQSRATNAGVPVFDRPFGSGFRLVVEAKPGVDGRAVGRSAYQSDLTAFPDLEI